MKRAAVGFGLKHDLIAGMKCCIELIPSNRFLNVFVSDFTVVVEILVDCDMDAIILKITQTGAACHEGYESCFFRRLKTDNKINIDDLSDDDLEIILERIVNPEDVY